MLSASLRRALAQINSRAAGDLEALWRQVSTAVEAKQALSDLLPLLVEKYGAAASVLGAQWYDDLRAKQGVGGSFRAPLADLGPSGADALAGYAVGPLFQAEPDWGAARKLAVGGLQRRVSNFARATNMQASIADPQSIGWQRMGAGGCSFCLMLIGRGDVYSEESADFASHDHCNCQAVPIFKGAEPIDVKDYVKSARNISDADRARVRAYIASH